MLPPMAESAADLQPWPRVGETWAPALPWPREECPAGFYPEQIGRLPPDDRLHDTPEACVAAAWAHYRANGGST